jgi:hypothetical protein
MYAIDWIKKTKFISKAKSSTLSLNYFLSLVIVFGIYSIFLSLLKMFGIISLPEFPRDYAYDLFLIFSRITYILVILISVSIVFRYLFVKLNVRYKLTENKLNNFQNNIQWPSKLLAQKKSLTLNININLLFILFILVSIFIPIIPQLPALNPENRYVGVDTFWYVTWVRPLDNSSVVDIVKSAFVEQSHGDRPFSLLLIYLFSKIFSMPGDGIDNLPILLNPITVITIFFLTKEIVNRPYVCLLASFFTMFSFQVLIGIYAGFYANWIGLIIGFLSTIFLFKFLKAPDKKYLICFSTLIISLLFFHVYTWTIFSLAIGLFLLFLLVSKDRSILKKTIVISLIVIAITILIDVFKDIAIGSSGGIQEDIKLADYYLGLGNLWIFIENLYLSVLISHGGIFGNGIVFFFVLIWAMFLSNLKNPFEIFFLVFFIILFPLIFFGYYNLQVRVLYDLPFQIPFVLSLIHISKRTQNPILFLAVSIIISCISLRTLTNFYFIEQ